MKVGENTRRLVHGRDFDCMHIQASRTGSEDIIAVHYYSFRGQWGPRSRGDAMSTLGGHPTDWHILGLFANAPACL